jgi:O-antigen ligase
MVSDILLALGLLLSTASQLRPTGAPVGPGELCLMAWVGLMLAREANRLGPPLTPALSKLLVFWLVFGAALSIGTLTGYIIGDVHDSGLFLHDAMAYPLLALVCCLSVAEPGAGARMYRVAWLFVGFGTTSLVLQLASASGLGVAHIDPWYWDRFRGWSANPLQLALLCVVLALTALHLADVAVRPGGRITAIACAVLAVYVGRLTKSDSFTLALVAAGPIFIALKLRGWMQSFGRRLPLRAAAAFIILFGAPLMLISALPLGSRLSSDATDLARQLAKDNGRQVSDEANLRFQIWQQAIDRGIGAGFLGLGPGPHLEIPPLLVAARATEIEPDHVDHPPANGVPDFEAHNTFLDLFTQGGLIAVLCFVALMAAAFLNTYRAASAGLTTLLCGLAIFSIPNLIIRHPIVWFAIAMCLVTGRARGAPATITTGR